MKIGFDAKRAFLNRSGLGNYSRNTLNALAKYFPDEDYFLFSPKISNEIKYSLGTSQKLMLPKRRIYTIFKSLWRTVILTRFIHKEKLNIYHGLSNEIPFRIEKSPCKSIVTIHDLIFIRYPELYKPIDRIIYKRKFYSSCKRANLVIAISEQTRSDLIDFFKVPKEKIKVVYQNCNPIFYEKKTKNEVASILNKLKLPINYILFVGTIERRKNVLTAIKAWHTAKIEHPFLIIGKITPYLEEVMSFIKSNKIEDKVFFKHDVLDEDLPAIYQGAFIFIYPSVFEGFGIPILEAMTSGVPVITSKGGCFEEVGGDAAIYIDYNSINLMKEAILKLVRDEKFRNRSIELGTIQADKFSEEKYANNLMEIYRNI